MKVHRNCCGLEVHKQTIAACLIQEDGSGNTYQEKRLFGTMTRDLRELAQGLRGAEVSAVAMEATGVYWVRVWNVLERAGSHLLLINPGAGKSTAARSLVVASVGHLGTVGAEVAVVASNLPTKQNVLHFRACSNVVHNHVMVAPTGLLIHNDANMRHTSAQVPSDEIAGGIVCCSIRNRESLSLALKEDHEIRHAAVVNVGIGMIETPAFLVRVSGEVPYHVFMDFLLQVNTQCTVGPDDLVGTDSGVCRDITVGVRNPNIVWNIADWMTGSLDCCGNHLLRELLTQDRG